MLVVIILMTIILHITIIELQKFIGGKFIFPKFLRKKPFNYYIDLEMIENNANVNNNFFLICYIKLIS